MTSRKEIDGFSEIKVVVPDYLVTLLHSKKRMTNETIATIVTRALIAHFREEALQYARLQSEVGRDEL
jgi:hypothetical protein